MAVMTTTEAHRLRGGARRPRTARVAAVYVAVALISFAAIYLLIANIALPAALRAAARHAGIEIQYDSAYALLPGRLYFHDLRLSGSAPTAWSLSFDRSSMNVDVRELVARRISITGFQGSGGEARLGDDLLAISLAVNAAFRIDDPGDARTASARARLRQLSGRADVEAELPSSGTRLPIESGARVDGRGPLRAKLALDHGAVTAGSELSVTGPLFVSHSEASTITLPQGLTLAVRATDAGALPLRVELSVPELSLSASGDSESDTVEDFRVEIDTGGVDLAEPEGGEATARVNIRRVRISKSPANLTCAARAEINLRELNFLLLSARLRSGTIEASDIAVAPRGGAPPRSPMSGQIAITGGVADVRGGISFAGSLRAQGSDAVALLDLGDAPTSLRFALGDLAGQPFTVDAWIARRPRALAIEDMRFNGGPFAARGALYERADHRAGALLVRRGALTFGISIEGGHIGVVFGPDAGWLSSHLESMKTR